MCTQGMLPDIVCSVKAIVGEMSPDDRSFRWPRPSDNTCLEQDSSHFHTALASCKCDLPCHLFTSCHISLQNLHRNCDAQLIMRAQPELEDNLSTIAVHHLGGTILIWYSSLIHINKQTRYTQKSCLWIKAYQTIPAVPCSHKILTKTFAIWTNVHQITIGCMHQSKFIFECVIVHLLNIRWLTNQCWSVVPQE